jgi:hypothetical protein
MGKPLLLVLAFCPMPAYSQLLLGRISGTVTDPSGAAVPNAKVKAVNRDTNLAADATTQPTGLYE